MFRPLKGNLLIKPKDLPDRTASGILLVNFNPNQAVEGDVVASGNMEELTVSETDSILYQFAAGEEVTINDEKYHVVKEEHVLGVRPEKSEGFFKVPDTGLYVTNLEKGEYKTRNGIIITDDHMKERGIRPRWAQIWQVGKMWEDELSPGQWVLLEHGNWSHIITLTTKYGSTADMQIIEEKSVRRGVLGVLEEKPDHLKRYGSNSFN